ncbi:MAG: glycosyltransferase [Phycisphaerales bacterium]
MTSQKIVHLVDDTTAGGVMRMLDHLMSQSGLAHQNLRKLTRGSLSSGRIDADVIVSHLTISWRGLPGLIALRAMNPAARIIHVEHSYTRAFTALNVARKARFFALLRVAYSLFDRVVAVSRAQAAWLEERRLVNPEALAVIPPDVPLEPLTALPRPTGTPRVIGAIGRLERQKGFDVLIEGFRLSPQRDARLLIFGEGSERAHLETLAAGDARIEFHGHAKDPAAAYRQVDIVAMPSRWEAFGLVAKEARAAGRPVIHSSVDGLADQIDETTQVVRARDPKAWANALGLAFTDQHAATAVRDRIEPAGNEDFVTKWREILASGARAVKAQDTVSTLPRTA